MDNFVELIPIICVVAQVKTSEGSSSSDLHNLANANIQGFVSGGEPVSNFGGSNIVAVSWKGEGNNLGKAMNEVLKERAKLCEGCMLLLQYKCHGIERTIAQTKDSLVALYRARLRKLGND